jgi:hypothetical protein
LCTTFAGAFLVPALLLAGPAGASTARAASSGTDATATAETLVDRYFTLLHDEDEAGLRKFLSPAFTLQRADGTGATKDEYLRNLPTVESFELTDLVAERAGDVLAVRYLAEATGVVDGRAYTPGPAPRLSVFVRDQKRWRIVAHANFNPLTGAQ